MPEAANNPRNASDEHPESLRDDLLLQATLKPNSHLQPGAPFHHHSLSLHLRGSLDEVTLVYALELLVSQQPALRLTFKSEAASLGVEHVGVEHVGSEQSLVVQPSMPLPFECRDLSWLNNGDAAEEWKSILRHEASTVFDLGRGPLFRTLLARLSPLHNVLVFTAHPRIADPSAIRTLMTKLAGLYETIRAGAPHQAIAHPVAAHPVIANQKAMAPPPEPTLQASPGSAAPLLPTDFLRTARQINVAASYSLALDAELATMVRCKSAANDGMDGIGTGGCLAALAAYLLWLHRVTGQTELVYGVAMNCGYQPEQDPEDFDPDHCAVSLSDELLPIRSQLLPQDDAAAFTARLQETIKQSRSHGPSLNPSAVPSSAPSAACDADHPGWARNQFRFESEEKPLRFADLEADLVWNGRPGFSAEIEVCFKFSGTTPSLDCTYNAALFKRETVVQWAAELERLLRTTLEQPEQRLSQSAWVSSGERHRLVFDLNQTARPYPRDYSLQELFERQALHTPDAIALVNEEGALTYAELNEKANQLARFLGRYGVRRGERIALVVERSLASVVGALATLKIGCAYVPIDALQTGPSVHEVVEHARPAAILTQAQFAPIFRNRDRNRDQSRKLDHERNRANNRPAPRPVPPPVPMVLLDEDWAAVATEAVESLAFPIAAEAPACVLYSCDAAGRPRGVQLPHRALVRQAHGWGGLNFGGEVFLQLAVPTAGAWALEVWAPLLNGGRLAMPPPGWQAPVQIGSAIEHYGATTVWLHAADLERIIVSHIEALAPLRQIVVCPGTWGATTLGTGTAGTAAISPALLRRLLERYPELKLISGFGPVENGSSACFNPVSPASAADAYAAGRDGLHAGRPTANTRVYILDRGREVVRSGTPGELHIAGDGLAIGYLHDPQLTERKFFMHTFSPLLRERLFGTGMLARYREDGRIEILGVLDTQIRVERVRAEVSADRISAAAVPFEPEHELEALEIFLAD